MTIELKKALESNVLVFDGAMGTMLETLGAKQDCNEELALSRPDVLSKVHKAYLDAGSDIITTNTFGASSLVLADHDLASEAERINAAAVKIAREAANSVSGRRFVAGELGPTSKLPTLGHISFSDLETSYAEQAKTFVAGGVDVIIIQTCQDPLQIKAALSACKKAFEIEKKSLPVIVSITVEKTGTMLLGTEISAALTTVSPYSPFAFGMNCATGPEDMEEQLSSLSRISPFAIACQPNAGMPKNVDGKPVYSLSPQDFSERLANFTSKFNLSIVGGCCGTTPDHISALKNAVSKTKPKRRVVSLNPSVSSLYTSFGLDQEPKPFLMAEQTNVNGSKKFREMLLKDDYDAMADVGQKAAAQGHALDICLAYAGRDEVRDFTEMVKRLTLKSQAPLMIDSTKPDAVEAALALIPGRPIINSINLEDGGEKAKRVLEIARRFGAAVVALTIDESGMAKTSDKKIEIAARIVELAVKYGLSPSDLLIDTLTFTLASGDPELKNAGMETLRAVSDIKKVLPGVRTMLGVSNISFGIPLKGRVLVTSAFLNRAVEAGLDAAIVNPARIVPVGSIPEDALGIINRLIDGDDSKGDPLEVLINYVEENGGDVGRRVSREDPKTPEEALKQKVADGSRDGLKEILDSLISKHKPSEIINGILLPAMQEVGVLFGGGKLPLPFVLQSAETMRSAIDLLTPLMDSKSNVSRGTMVLATVRGDVHDIGKNLVDAILSNNGFKVVNLGIKQSAQAIVEAAKKEGADAIGLSGLLVSSTEIMREDLEVFKDSNLTVPVLCGGAALTPSFVDKVLSKAYGSEVVYCQDAFSGLKAMEKISVTLNSGSGTKDSIARK